jgi:site-specific DNA recombinase
VSACSRLTSALIVIDSVFGRPFRLSVASAFKRTESGPRLYVYLWCSNYSQSGHPRDRVTGAELDGQNLALFDRMRIADDGVREWFRTVLASQTRDRQAESLARRAELQRQETLLVQQQDRLLNLQIDDSIDQATYARKATELRDRLASIKLQLEAVDRSHDESAELACKVIELSQTLRDRWVTADFDAKRRILEFVCLNCTLVGATRSPTIRKPFYGGTP